MNDLGLFGNTIKEGLSVVVLNNYTKVPRETGVKFRCGCVDSVPKLHF